MKLLSGVVFSVIGCLAMASAPTFAVGTDPAIGPHSGNVGLHTLVDTGSYPGAVCKYGASDHLRSISVRPPILYAFDRTAKTDVEWVAWRVIVEYAPPVATAGGYVDWPDFVKSPWTKVQASDIHNARWSRKTVQLPAGSDQNPVYRVSVQMRWFHPGSSNVDGRAVHVVGSYLQKAIGGSAATNQCVETVATSAAGDDAGHSGSFGVHALFDSSEYPDVTCTFHNFDPRDDLKRITVRPPIAYAVDRTSATDSQWVGWRFRVQAEDVPNPLESDWFDVYTAPIVKVTATDAYNAQWQSRSFSIADGTVHADWRAVVDMYWFYPNRGTQSGKATQYPAWYEIAAGSDRFPTGRQGCGDTLG